MSDPGRSDDNDWAAERREFVADHRDELARRRDAIADEREAAADARERDADAREAALDAFELRLDERSAAIGLTPVRSVVEHDADADHRELARLEREAAHAERVLQAEGRVAAGAARDAAAAQRELDHPTTRLATAFAELARRLYEAENSDEVLARIAAATVSTVAGCTMASVTLREGAGYRTAASTAQQALDSDRAQYDADEGPCIDAVDNHVVYAPAFPDARWPVLGDRPRRLGAESVISYQLTSPSKTGGDSLAGSLNAYSGERHAYDEEAQHIGLVLAAHASVAAGAMREHETLEHMSRQLHDALSSRDVIGQAKGILMERLRLTPEAAFDVLRRTSQQLNVKLREVAETLAETGDLPDGSGTGSTA